MTYLDRATDRTNHALDHVVKVAGAAIQDALRLERKYRAWARRYCTCFKVGGLHFVRVGRLQVSFCVCKKRV